MKKIQTKKSKTGKPTVNRKGGETGKKVKQPAHPATPPTVKPLLEELVSEARILAQKWLRSHRWRATLQNAGNGELGFQWRDPVTSDVMPMERALLLQCDRSSLPGPVNVPHDCALRRNLHVSRRHLVEHGWTMLPRQVFAGDPGHYRNGWAHPRLRHCHAEVVGLNVALLVQDAWTRDERECPPVGARPPWPMEERSVEAPPPPPEPRVTFCFTWMDDVAMRSMVENAPGRDVYDSNGKEIGKVVSAHVDSNGHLQGEVELATGAKVRGRLA
jgi:hypothetical protein